MTISTSTGAVEASSHPTPDLTFLHLSRLLQRLESSILSDRGAQSLQASSVERTKTTAHVETARNLLVQLENEESRAPKTAIGTVRHKQTVRHADLQEKRAVLKQLQERLFELNHADNGDQLASMRLPSKNDNGGDDVDGDDEEEDILARYAPAHASTHVKAGAGNTATSKSEADTFGLRQRAGNAHKSESSSTATARAGDLPGHSIGTTQPFAPKPDSVKTHAQLLEAHDTQQEQITSDLLQLASKLRQSTLSFAESLATSGDVVDRAAQSLDQNVTGMEKASTQMNLLRRATSGWNYFHKLSVYVRIAILWAAVILLVFVLPKLR